MESEESENRRKELRAALGLSWLERALGKSSNAAFSACKENALNILPQLKSELHGVDLHHAGNAWSVISRMEQNLPKDIRYLVSGRTPDIQYLTQLLGEEEE